MAADKRMRTSDPPRINKLRRTVNQCIRILILFLSLVPCFNAAGKRRRPHYCLASAGNYHSAANFSGEASKIYLCSFTQK
jgi:hypothetical protein